MGAPPLDPLEDLRSRKPFLFSAPEFWPVGNGHIREKLQSARRGKTECLGYSAGGREILAVSYGEFHPAQSRATISSAMASDRPEAFFDPSSRSRLTLILIGCIHGGETEGIALCLNLIQLLEKGADHRGHSLPALMDLLEKVRLVIVPCLNPDGREAAGVAHLRGADRADLYLVQQGIQADGTLFQGRKVKEVQPIPPGFLRFMGGYYNAAGVNLQHDDFFGPRLTPENEAIRALFGREIPDAFLTLHAHSAPAAVLAPDAFVSPGVQRKQIEAAGYLLSRLAAAGVPCFPSELAMGPPWSFYFQTWLHHMSGALPLQFEFCQGLDNCPCSFEQALDTGFVLVEAWVEYNLRFGPRPRSPELFAPPPHA